MHRSAPLLAQIHPALRSAEQLIDLPKVPTLRQLFHLFVVALQVFQELVTWGHRYAFLGLFVPPAFWGAAVPVFLAGWYFAGFMFFNGRMQSVRFQSPGLRVVQSLCWWFKGEAYPIFPGILFVHQ